MNAGTGSVGREKDQQGATSGDKVKWLRDLGFFIGARNPLLNTRYPGRYMVAEKFDAAQLPTEDAGNGPCASSAMMDLLSRPAAVNPAALSDIDGLGVPRSIFPALVR